MFLRLLPVLSLTLSTISLVRASVDCLPNYEWSYNHQKNSPCDVASALLKECDPAAGSLQPLTSNASGDAYYDPTQATQVNACLCNTITYSLVSACGICQGQSYLYWHTWVDVCNNASVSVWLYNYPLPLPPGLDVPLWAYMDVTTIDYFSIRGAFRNATFNLNATQTNSQTLSTPTLSPPSPKSDSSNGTNISNSNITYNMIPTSQDTSSSTTGGGRGSNVDIATLIGAITGSISGLVIVGLAILRYMAFRKSQRAKQEERDEEKHGLVDKQSFVPAETNKGSKLRDPDEARYLNSEVELETDANGDPNFHLHA
ncbi:hypothetical protein JR316_0003192 [Psilocybe cubensis]|uniref:Uncharacterized protein n=2 Tax=Psilocybe cubensis TaxID=181762 RepID=A0ACB8H885_PSICU|nr:hypothetical protein JR316_0003192 [Psilocybe cubensis]KAH9483716.1 hypothetical protein JR316_0003192 [Psilocybe cubensis]